MVPKRRIALISDLHIGHEVISVDLCPYELDPKAKFGLETEFLKKFRMFVGSDEFRSDGAVDMLCVTGDISDKANPAEFEHAHSVILEIADALGVPNDKVFFVPGNHDVNWPVMKLDPGGFWGKFRYEPLLQDRLIFRSQLAEAVTGAYDVSPHFVAWETGGDLIVGINSAAFDDPNPFDGKHHGLIQQETIQKLEVFLQSRPLNFDGVRICLVHHHPLNYSDSRPDMADFSAATNSENLFKLLSEHRFDLVFHGHKHVPQLNHLSQITNGHPVTILGAGSLSAQISPKWCGLAQNQFHVVSVEGRDDSSEVAFGFVATWNYLGETWRRANSLIGLCAKEGFGTAFTPAELEHQISNHIEQTLTTTSVQLWKWPQIERELPRLSYASTRAIHDELQSVSIKYGFEFNGDLQTEKKSWLMIREAVAS